MRNISIQRIETFNAVYETGSLTAAAEKLRVSQPTISKHLASFQESIGFPLFTNLKGKLYPTSEAQTLYSETRGLFECLGQTETLLSDLKQGRGLRLKVITLVTGSDLELVGQSVGRVLEKWPQAQIDLQTGDVDTHVAALRHGGVDFSFGRPMMPQADIENRSVCENEMVAVMPSNHPLAKLERIPLAAFNEYRSVLLSENTLVGGRITNMLRQAGVELKNNVSTSNGPQLPMLAYSLNCLTIAEIITAHRAKSRMDIAVVPLDPPLRFEVGANWRKSRPLSAIAEFFLDDLGGRLSEEIARMREELFGEEDAS